MSLLSSTGPYFSRPRPPRLQMADLKDVGRRQAHGCTAARVEPHRSRSILPWGSRGHLSEALGAVGRLGASVGRLGSFGCVTACLHWGDAVPCRLVFADGHKSAHAATSRRPGPPRELEGEMQELRQSIPFLPSLRVRRRCRGRSWLSPRWPPRVPLYRFEQRRERRIGHRRVQGFLGWLCLGLLGVCLKLSALGSKGGA